MAKESKTTLIEFESIEAAKEQQDYMDTYAEFIVKYDSECAS